ncbi:MAG: spirocyclase AveC family protein [bacterium]
MNVSTAQPAPLEGEGFSQAKFWAWFGVFWYAVILYSLASWIGNGAATYVDPGTSIPAIETIVWIIAFDIMGPICCVWVIMRVTVIPKLKTGKFTSDGLLTIAFLLIFWQDPLLAYSTPWFFYNSLHFNLGNWVEFVPGALSPNTRFISEPLLTWSTAYVFFMLWPVMFTTWAMRKWKQLKPQAGFFTLCSVAILAGFGFDFVMEVIFLHTGGYAYPGSWENFSLFSGDLWQFPIQEILLWGGCYGIWGCLRYFKDDKGYMICERGVDKLKVSEGQRTFIRFLAISGLMQSVMIFCYNVPMQWWGSHGDTFPAGYPTYLSNGICGEGTDYACPGPMVPINRTTESMSITPELEINFGKLPKEEILLNEITN